jgi:acyl-CoA reductase-like NAD-dependent aldehyde dehydrogenase
VDNPPLESRIVTEEPFGPIVPTIPFDTIDEAIAMANNTNTGLAACVWSTDSEKAIAIAKKIEAGSVFINSFEKLTPAAAFGGHKDSGIGDEWGPKGWQAFCNKQVLHIFN